MGDSFTHLHLHTEFSMLDGAARIGQVVGRAGQDGQPAIGITDHGNMYGVLDFYKECNSQGIKPIIGTEAYMAGETRHERPVRRGNRQTGRGSIAVRRSMPAGSVRRSRCTASSTTCPSCTGRFSERS